MLKATFPTFCLFIFSGSLALWVSQKNPNVSSEAVKWITIPDNKIQSLQLDTNKEVINLEKDEIGGFWGTIASKEKKDEEGYRFRCNKEIRRILEGFNPLYARRIVGKGGDLKLEEFGFSETSTVLRVSLGDATKKEFFYGKRSYGSGNLYIRAGETDKVALVDSDIFDLLKRARSSLIERNIWDRKIFDSMNQGKVTFGSKEIVIAKDSSSKDRWSAKEKNIDSKVLDNWVGNLNKLRILDYPNKVAQDALNKIEPVFSLKLSGGGEDQELSLYKFKADKDQKVSYWVKSSYLNGFGKVSFNRSETLEKDIKSMLGT